MRIGWLIWERTLTEFLYFEERMEPPNPKNFWADWHETPARGVRKSSKNLWIYEKSTEKKRYSVTTNAGIKIQPYFDVPPHNDPNLCFFRVQGEEISDSKVLIWVTAATAKALSEVLGNLQFDTVSRAIVEAAEVGGDADVQGATADELAQQIEISKDAYTLLTSRWGGVSDEHRCQLLLHTIRGI